MKKHLIIAIILLGLGLMGWQIKQKTEQKTALGLKRRGSVAVAVETRPVLRQTIRRTREFGGTLLPKVRSVIAPKVSGRLEKILVNLGSPVKKGDLIAVLDSDEYGYLVNQVKAELGVVNASLTEANSALAVARKDFERKEKLYQKTVIPLSEYEAAEAKYHAALATRNEVLAQIEQKKAAIKSALVRLSYAEIRADWENGPEERLVSERFADEGTMLKANDPIVAIVDISSVIGVINVIERDYPKINIGQSVVIHTDAYPDRSFAGRVIRKSPVLKESSRQARVEIEIPNPQRELAPGMFIRAVMLFEEHAETTVVPMEALVKRNGEQGVFMADMKDLKARFVPITTGIISNGLVEVVKPNLHGRVITLGHHLLLDDTTIIPTGVEAGPEKAPAFTNLPKQPPARQ